MRMTPLYAPDGMSSGGRFTERFDDGLVHNHHWAVSADEAYPSHSQGSPMDTGHGRASTWDHVTGSRLGGAMNGHHHHDDGLVHNHDWAVTSK